MAERRRLVAGLPTKPTEEELAFIQGKLGRTGAASADNARNASPVVATAGKSPLSTRIRTDFAMALKRASLERQLQSIEPSTISDILEDALESWLQTNGYLP